MASEQSSQSHLPSAWPEAAEPSPSWTNDPLGTGPRLPRPQDEPRSGNGSSWQTSPGAGQHPSASPADSPGGRPQSPPPHGDGHTQSPQADGWAQATSPQNNGWAQASTPRTDSWSEAFSPRNDGWAQASTPQGDGWAQASGPQGSGGTQTSGPQGSRAQGDGWAQASGPQGAGSQGDGWAQASGSQDADNSHQTSPGNGWPQPTPSQDGWAQAGTPSNDGRPSTTPPDDGRTRSPQADGWAQASNPRNDGWAQASNPQGDGWAQASGPQGSGGTQPSGPQNDGWAQTSGSQGPGSQGDGWAQASGPQDTGGSHQTSPGNGWPQPTPSQDGWAQASGPQAEGGHPSSPNNGWPQSTPSQDGDAQHTSTPQTGSSNGWAQATAPSGGGWPDTTPSNDGRTQSPQDNGWAQASSPQGDARRQGSGAAAGEAWQSSAPGHDAPAWPPAQTTENGGWPPSPPAENAPWPPAAPAGGGAWPPAPSSGNAGPAEAQTSAFSPSWASGDAPAAPFGGAHPGAAQGNAQGTPSGVAPGTPPFPGGSPDGGPPNSAPNGAPNGDGTENARRSYGVPDTPAMWALAANAAASNAPAPPGAPVHPGAGLPPSQAQPGRPGHPGQPGQPTHPGQPGHPGHPGQPAHPGQPGHHLSRDPSDPNKPFVTAGQISGPKTPPPERQQELWNTVFGDNYQAIEDEDELGERGRPVWIFALAGSAAIALLGAVLWAFLAGPLAGGEEIPSDPKPSAAATKKPAKPAAIGRLPRFTGDASPVAGTLTDQQAGITLARLGAPWRQDQRPGMPASYGFTTRQYLPAGTDSTGKTQFAQLMSGPLSPRLKSKYTSPENLAPVINAVASNGRNKFFPEGNTARKTAQQTLSVNGLPGQLAAYEITSGDSKTTMVVAAVSTGADLPSIVYMSVPDSKKELLPDINTVFKSIRAAGQ
ncbi:hypothetical protein [Streptosporangium vulgare]|uniref:Uncharacterized protein n=1 Tax=Streptosporangium vulgare TaxID=46190 RepID=A0ABV5TKY7_9ACTN